MPVLSLDNELGLLVIYIVIDCLLSVFVKETKVLAVPVVNACNLWWD